MTDNAKIVEVAGLMLKLDQYKNEDDPACLEDSARFEQAVKGLSQAEMMAVNMAYKLRQGKPYMVCSDNQEEIGGYKSLAEYMGQPWRRWKSRWRLPVNTSCLGP